MARSDEMIERELNNIRLSLKLLVPLLNDPDTTDVFVSFNGNVSVKRFGKLIEDENIFLNIDKRFQILNQIAKYFEINIDFDDYPVLEATIPLPEYENCRITGIYPPFSKSPSFTIRKPADNIYTLEQYVEKKQLAPEHYNIIINYIKDKKNIIVSGGTGTGKTTFINAVILKKSEFYPKDRFFIAQDINELQCNAQYIEWVFVRPEQAVKAVRLALRQSPDSIIFGEVRDGVVMAELLDCWNTGHPGGITSIHANTSISTITRIQTLLRQKYVGELPKITELIDLIVHLQKSPMTGMCINEVMEIKNQGNLEDLFSKAAELKS
jgi:type IV secretion system protein VirB11